jgi:formate hydrogenlyase subunit 4
MERSVILSFLHVVLLLLFAPLVPGVINRTKSFMGGRKGPPLLQAYYDISKLLRKQTARSATTTWIFFAGAAVTVSTAVAATLFLPVGDHSPVISFTGDMLVFVYLFALARFFITTAAMDTGSAFEGMGASREVTFSALAEPALLLGLLSLARLSGSLHLSEMLAVGKSGAWEKASASVVLIIVGWFILVLAENSRVPFDDPTTHLELTMIHEAMVLDHGGPGLGFLFYGAALKLTLFSALLGSLILPVRSGMQWIDTGATLVGILIVAIATGLVESSMARLRLVRVPQLLITATLLVAFAVILLLRNE